MCCGIFAAALRIILQALAILIIKHRDSSINVSDLMNNLWVCESLFYNERGTINKYETYKVLSKHIIPEVIFLQKERDCDLALNSENTNMQ